MEDWMTADWIWENQNVLFPFAAATTTVIGVLSLEKILGMLQKSVLQCCVCGGGSGRECGARHDVTMRCRDLLRDLAVICLLRLLSLPPLISPRRRDLTRRRTRLTPGMPRPDVLTAMARQNVDY